MKWRKHSKRQTMVKNPVVEFFKDTLTDIYLRLRFMTGVWFWHNARTATGAANNQKKHQFLYYYDLETFEPKLRLPEWADYREDMRWMVDGGPWETF